MRSTLWYDQPGIGAGSGAGYIEKGLRWARAADPNAKRFYNDYDAEEINAKSDAIYAMAKDFKKRGVPLDGIGFSDSRHSEVRRAEQAGVQREESGALRQTRPRSTHHGTGCSLTDSSPASLEAQAHLYGEITRLCLQQPGCKLIQTWGFTGKYSWIPGFFKGYGWDLLWDDNYWKKPAYAALHDALAQ
jgi:endo-1,4-beta-xylanase